MKRIKALVLTLSMVFMFALSGCSSEEKTKPFDYKDNEMVIATMTFFQGYTALDDSYYDDLQEYGSDFDKSAIKGIEQAKDTDKVSSFQDYSELIALANAYGADAVDLQGIDYSISYTDELVTVKISNKAKLEDGDYRNVDVSVSYSKNGEYSVQAAGLAASINVDEYKATLDSYAEMYGMSAEDVYALAGVNSLEELIDLEVENQLAESNVLKYIPEEMVVSVEYTRAELLGQAGTNTLIGMGTVFVVLIFISFIISLFKFLPKIFGGEGKAEEKKAAAPKAAAPAPAKAAASEDLMNDAELVAVITAAIYAMQAETNSSANMLGASATCTDTLVVRSIKRARR